MREKKMKTFFTAPNSKSKEVIISLKLVALHLICF